MYVSTSDDHAQTFSPPVSLHVSANSLPDQLRLAVHPEGAVVAVWKEVTGVRKRIAMRISLDRGNTFSSVQTLNSGVKAEYPVVAIHPSEKNRRGVDGACVSHEQDCGARRTARLGGFSAKPKRAVDTQHFNIRRRCGEYGFPSGSSRLLKKSAILFSHRA
jgi:hypothetical protein